MPGVVEGYMCRPLDRAPGVILEGIGGAAALRLVLCGLSGYMAWQLLP